MRSFKLFLILITQLTSLVYAKPNCPNLHQALHKQGMVIDEQISNYFCAFMYKEQKPRRKELLKKLQSTSDIQDSQLLRALFGSVHIFQKNYIEDKLTTVRQPDLEYIKFKNFFDSYHVSLHQFISKYKLEENGVIKLLDLNKYLARHDTNIAKWTVSKLAHSGQILGQLENYALIDEFLAVPTEMFNSYDNKRLLPPINYEEFIKGADPSQKASKVSDLLTIESENYLKYKEFYHLIINNLLENKNAPEEFKITLFDKITGAHNVKANSSYSAMPHAKRTKVEDIQYLKILESAKKSDQKTLSNLVLLQRIKEGKSGTYEIRKYGNDELATILKKINSDKNIPDSVKGNISHKLTELMRKQKSGFSLMADPNEMGALLMKIFKQSMVNLQKQAVITPSLQTYLNQQGILDFDVNKKDYLIRYLNNFLTNGEEQLPHNIIKGIDPEVLKEFALSADTESIRKSLWSHLFISLTDEQTRVGKDHTYKFREKVYVELSKAIFENRHQLMHPSDISKIENEYLPTRLNSAFLFERNYFKESLTKHSPQSELLKKLKESKFNPQLYDLKSRYEKQLAKGNLEKAGKIFTDIMDLLHGSPEAMIELFDDRNRVSSLYFLRKFDHVMKVLNSYDLDVFDENQLLDYFKESEIFKIYKDKKKLYIKFFDYFLNNNIDMPKVLIVSLMKKMSKDLKHSEMNKIFFDNPNYIKIFKKNIELLLRDPPFNKAAKLIFMQILDTYDKEGKFSVYDFMKYIKENDIKISGKSLMNLLYNKKSYLKSDNPKDIAHRKKLGAIVIAYMKDQGFTDKDISFRPDPLKKLLFISPDFFNLNFLNPPPASNKEYLLNNLGETVRQGYWSNGIAHIGGIQSTNWNTPEGKDKIIKNINFLAQADLLEIGINSSYQNSDILDLEKTLWPKAYAMVKDQLDEKVFQQAQQNYLKIKDQIYDQYLNQLQDQKFLKESMSLFKDNLDDWNFLIKHFPSNLPGNFDEIILEWERLARVEGSTSLVDELLKELTRAKVAFQAHQNRMKGGGLEVVSNRANSDQVDTIEDGQKKPTKKVNKTRLPKDFVKTCIKQFKKIKKKK